MDVVHGNRDAFYAPVIYNASGSGGCCSTEASGFKSIIIGTVRTDRSRRA